MIEDKSSGSDSEGQDIVGATVTLIKEPSDSIEKEKQIQSKHAKKLLETSIEHGADFGTQFVPQTK